MSRPRCPACTADGYAAWTIRLPRKDELPDIIDLEMFLCPACEPGIQRAHTDEEMMTWHPDDPSTDALWKKARP